MTLALCVVVEDEAEDEGQSREVMTQLVTALNCAMVAQIVGERFSFLSR